nr:MAG TPA: hypothetical protein [Caudoviricetes sp.]
MEGYCHTVKKPVRFRHGLRYSYTYLVRIRY